jgi:hypothetical protein
MKNIFLFLIIVTTSCTQNNSYDAVKKEITDLTTQYKKNWETLNADQIATYHSDESFLYWGNGELQDAESIGLDGTVSNHGSGALTYVWNKINGNWKIVLIHESAKK